MWHLLWFMWVKYNVCDKLFLLPKCENKMHLFPSLPHQGSTFTGGQDELKSHYKSEWQQQDRWWLGGVWGRGLECIIMHKTAGSGDGEAAGPSSMLSELNPQHCSVFPARDSCSNPQPADKKQKPSEETLHCPTDSAHTFTLPKCQTEIGINHTRANTHKHGWRVLSSVAVIKSCSWALLLLSPCDWCLASLAVTNTDWSQTLNDFGPNLFKDSSLLCAHKTCVQLLNIWAQSVSAELRRLDGWGKKRWQKFLTFQPPLWQELDRVGRCPLFQLVSHLHRERQSHCWCSRNFNICSLKQFPHSS